VQYLNGDSGLKSEALWTSMTTMLALVAVRGYFLLVKPGYMEGQANAKKVQ
jgi:hypothetical protein